VLPVNGLWNVPEKSHQPFNVVFIEESEVTVKHSVALVISGDFNQTIYIISADNVHQVSIFLNILAAQNASFLEYVQITFFRFADQIFFEILQLCTFSAFQDNNKFPPVLFQKVKMNLGDQLNIL
jgi:hypothetical protein